MQVVIEFKKQKGFVLYDVSNSPVKFEVKFPDEAVAKGVTNFLQVKRLYRVPQSNEIDHYIEEMQLPTQSEWHFISALSELYAATGVYVLWKAEKEI